MLVGESVIRIGISCFYVALSTGSCQNPAHHTIYCGTTQMSKLVAIGNDHAGLALKQALIPELEALGFTAVNLGTDTLDSVDYPDYGQMIAQHVAEGRVAFGVAICGSGIGISIACNRVASVRAALCHTGLHAELARKHNDANVLALGARLIGVEEAKECVRRFLTTKFEGGRHESRVAKLGA